MVQRVRLLYGIVMLCALVCGTIASCGRSGKQSGTATIQEANRALKIRELPTLPPSVTSVQFWKGGAFAKYMNVKFTASPQEATDYFKRAGAEDYFEFQEQNGKYPIVATHALSDSPVTTQKPNLFELELKTGLRSEPWFKSVYDTRHGWYWSKLDVTGYQLYYDVDTQQFYIYWWYS